MLVLLFFVQVKPIIGSNVCSSKPFGVCTVSLSKPIYGSSVCASKPICAINVRAS